METVHVTAGAAAQASPGHPVAIAAAGRVAPVDGHHLGHNQQQHGHHHQGQGQHELHQVLLAHLIMCVACLSFGRTLLM